MSDTTPIYIAFSAVQSKALKNLYYKYGINRKQFENMSAIRYIAALKKQPQVSYTALSEILGHNHFSKDINKKRLQHMINIDLIKESTKGKFFYLELSLTGIMIMEYYEGLFLDLIKKAEKNHNSRLLYGYIFPAPESYQPIIPNKILTPWSS